VLKQSATECFSPFILL